MPQITPAPIDPLPKPKPQTQAGKIINALKAAGTRGVENYKLANYNLGYRARITDLRQDGYNIYCERQRVNGRATGVWLYYLREGEV